MTHPSPPIPNTLGWITTLLVPFALVLTAVRLLLTPAFVHIEYRTPNFPPDRYGFTLQDRLKWSQVSLDYLLNDEGIEFLENQHFDDGVPIYNARELGHMVDVKNVIKAVLKVWVGSVGVLIGIGIWAWRGGWLDSYRLSLVRGGWLTAGFVGAVILFVLVAFGVFFVFFHEVFFDPGTWTFLFTDTLIRLFPERFWRDTFIWVGGLSILEALAVIKAAGMR
ncbi:MAG: TIGR01906 family membrane protein [Anaerolineales bacterium]